MAKVNCSIVPTITEDGAKSKVFNSILNFKGFITDSEIADSNIPNVYTIRDLATYVFGISNVLANSNPSMVENEDTGEVPVSSTLKYLIDNPKVGDKAKALYTKMLSEITQTPSLVYDDTIAYDGKYTPSQQQYFNLVLGRAYLKVLQKYKDGTYKTALSLKKEIVNQLRQDINSAKEQYDGIVDPIKDQYVVNFYIELFKPNSELWSSFIAYLNNTYGTRFNDSQVTLKLEDDELSIDSSEGVEDLWDPTAQEKVNRRNTVAFVVKQQLAEMLTDFDDVHSSNDYLYIQQPQDINTLWNRLIQLHLNDITTEDVLESLRSIVDQYPSVNRIIEQFEAASSENPNEDAVNFVNAYISSIRLAVIPANILALDSSFRPEIYTNNRNAFGQDIVADRYVSVIQSNIALNLYDKDRIIELGKQAKELRNINSPLYNDLKVSGRENRVYDRFIATFDYLGFNINRVLLVRYVNSQNITPEIALSNIADRLYYLLQSIYSSVAKGEAFGQEQYNSIHTLAEIEAKDFNGNTSLSYLGVNGELRYSPQFDSFVTKLFRGLVRNGRVNQTYLEYIFAPYLEDKRLNNPLASDNLLIYDSETGIGMFERKETVQEGEFPYKLNTQFANDLIHQVQMNLSQFEGIKLRSKGFNYRDIQSTMYNFTELVYALKGQHILLTSDSPRSYSVSIKSIKTGDVVNSDGTINRQSPIFKALSKIVNSEIADFETAGKVIFKESNDNITKYHNRKYSNGKTFLDKNGIPTGRAFKFLNITYKENGQTVDFIDYVSNQLGIDKTTAYQRLVQQTLGNSQDRINLNDYVAGFIEEYINWNINTIEEYYGGNREAIDSILANERSREEILDRYGIDSNTTTDVFESVVLGAVLNHTVYSVSFDNLVAGNITEYKDTTDLNKRSNAPIKNGSNSIDNSSIRRILLIQDIEDITNMFDIAFSENISDSDKVTDPNIIRAYRSAITYNDAQSIMTDVALERYLKATGRWNEYKDLFTQLRDTTKPFDPRAYNRLVESLKTFAYARRARKEFHPEDVDDYFNSQVESVQVKDSTVVLFPSTAVGSLKNLYDFMTNPNNNIDQISPVSAVKVSGVTPLKIVNSFRDLTLSNNVESSVITLRNTDFVIQQDVKPALVDENIVIGNQFTKQLLQGLNDTEPVYNFNGRKLTGKEIRDIFQKTMYTNIKEDAMQLLYELGGINNDGTFRLDEKGNITISYPKFVKLLQDVVEDDLSSSNIKEAIRTDDKGMPTLPLSYPVVYSKFEHILLSKIAKKVLNQKLLGFHVPIVSDTFNIPLGTNELAHQIAVATKEGRDATDLIAKYNAKIDELVNNGIVTYSDDFIAKCHEEHRSLELRSEYKYDENGQLVNYAEVIANPFSLELFNTIGVNKEVTYVDADGNKQTKVFKSVDINAIPKEARQLIGIRIPTEGKQSMVLFEIVGFLNTGSSQAIFPAQLIKRTGWDFDIDSIYAYRRNIFFDRGNYSVEKFGDNTEVKKGQKGHNFKDTILSDKYRQLLAGKNIEDPRINAVDGSLINGTLTGPKYTLLINALYNLFNPNSTTEKVLTNNISSLQEIVDNAWEVIASLSNEEFSSEDRELFAMIKNYLNGSIPNAIATLKDSVQKYYDYTIELYNAKQYAEKALGRKLTDEETYNLTTKVGNNYTKRSTDFAQDTLIRISERIASLERYIDIIKDKISGLSEESKSKLGNLASVIQSKTEDVSKGIVIANYKGNNVPINIFKVNNNSVELAQELFRQYKQQFKYSEDIYESNSREARDNQLIDLAFAILGNKEHAVQVNKPNEADHINACADRDNGIWEVSFSGLNAHNLHDKMVLATTSMGSTVLKGHSVNFDNFIAIASSLQAYSDRGVSKVVDIRDLPQPMDSNGNVIRILNEGGNITKEYAKFLNDRLGKGNWRYIPDRACIYFNDKYFGNDASNKKLDISGNDISLQQNETTTAILDSVKKPLMFVLNTDTLTVFRMLSSGTVTERFYDPNNTNNKEVNRFSYASAFIQQPAIVKVIENLNTNLITNSEYSINRSINDTLKYYVDLLIKSINNEQLEHINTYNKPLYTKLKGNRTPLLTAEDIYYIADVLKVVDETHVDREYPTYYTTRELVKFMQDRNNLSPANIISQIKVLEVFARYYTQARKISNLTFTLKTESKLTSFSKLDHEELQKADYYITKDTFNFLLNKELEASYDKIKYIKPNNNTSSTEIEYDFQTMYGEEFKQKYTDLKNISIVTIKDVLKALDVFDYAQTVQDRKNLIASYGIDYTPDFDIKVGNKSIVDAIFVTNEDGYIDENTAQFKDFKSSSVYPIILARYQFGRLFGTTAFNKIFAQRSDAIRVLVNAHLTKLGKSYDEVLRNKMITQLMNYVLEGNVGTQVSLFQDVAASTLKTIIGTHGENHQSIINKYVANIKDKLSDEEFADYLKLSIAEQLVVINNNPTLQKYINKPDFRGSNIFKFIQSSSKGAYGNRKGFDVVRVIRDDDTSVTTDLVVESIKQMWDSPNPFIAHTIRSLIAYTYITESFNYGTNIARYIPIELITELTQNDVYDGYIRRLGYNSPVSNISLYGNNLTFAENALINDELGDLQPALEFIGRQISELNLYVPSRASQAKIAKNTPNSATMGYLINGDGVNVGRAYITNKDGKLLNILFETEGRLRESKYATAQLVSETVDGVTTIYKRYDIPNSNIINPNNQVVAFIPVGKLLRNEFTEESLVDDYNISHEIVTSDGNTIDLLNYLAYSPEYAAFITTVDNYTTENTQDVYVDEYNGSTEETLAGIEQISEDAFENDYSDINANEEPLHSINININAKPYKKSLTESAKELAEKANSVIYIGIKPNIKYNVYSNAKYIVEVDYTKDPIREAERIAKQLEQGIIHIDGESANDITINKSNAYYWTNIFIGRLYELVPNIKRIQTLVTDGISEYVASSKLSNITTNYVLDNGKDSLHSVNIDIEDSNASGFNSKLFANVEIAIKALEATKRIINTSRYQRIPGIESISAPYYSLANEGFTEDLPDLLRRKDNEAMEVTFDKLNKIYKSILESAKIIYEDINKTNVYNLENDYIKYQKYKEKLVLAKQLIDSIAKFDSIRTITMEELGLDETNENDIDIFNQQFAIVNTQLRELQDIYTQSKEISAELTALADKVLVATVIKVSRNPAYATAFRKVLEKVRQADVSDIDNIEFGDLKVSDEERIDILTKVTDYVNSDISRWQLYLDSSFVTTNTTVDVTGRTYADAKYAAEKEIRRITDELDAALEEVSPGLSKENAGKRRAEFFKQFVTEYGDLIGEYDEAIISTELDAIKQEMFDIKYNLYDNPMTLSSDNIRTVANEFSGVIEKANSKGLFKLTQLSEAEQNVAIEDMREMSDNERLAYLRRNNLVDLYAVNKLEEGVVAGLYKIQYLDKAKNPDYLKLGEKEQAFISKVKGIIQDILVAYNPNYVPFSEQYANLFPYLKEGKIKDIVNKFVAIPKVRRDRFYESINGEKVYLVEPSTIEVPKKYHIFNVPKRNTGETYEAYKDRVVEEFKDFYDTSKDVIYDAGYIPRNIKEVYDYNRNVRLANKKYSTTTRSYDIKDVLKAFATDLYETKIIKDYTTSWQLTKATMVSHGADMQAPNLMQALERQMKVVANVSRINNKLDVAASYVLRYTSMTFMYGNITAGIKNMLSGITNMINESTPNGLVSTKDVKDGIGKMIAIAPKWIANFKSERTDDLDIAILKDFDTIYQDTRDTFVSTSGAGYIASVLSKVDTIGYLPNNIGEWVMQFGMLFAATKSFRLVGNRAMSFNQFYNENKDKAAREIFTQEQRDKYYSWKAKKDEEISKYESRNNKKYIWNEDYIGEFLRFNKDLFTKEQIKKFIEFRKDNKDVERKKFESFPRLYDTFEVKDGRLGFKESYDVPDEYMTEFRETVKAINQSLHGIYNRVDRMSIQDSILGELFVQFRKWMRATWNRYMGRRFNKTVFNETLGTFEVPVYKPIFDYLTYGIRKYKSENGELGFKDTLKAIVQITKWQLQALANIKYYYNTLNIHEQAAVDRWVKHTSIISAVGVLAGLLLAMKPDDDDEESFAYTLAMYELSAWFKEIVEPVPLYGWYSTYQSVRDKPFVSENILSNAYKVLYGSTIGLFLDDEKMIYQRGIYKGESKTKVALEKLVPFMKEYNKWINLKSSMQLYNYYNPFI